MTESPDETTQEHREDESPPEAAQVVAPDVETLAALCLESLHNTDFGWKYRPTEAAERILASSWLADHDARLRESIAAEIEARPPGTVPTTFGDEMPWHRGYQAGCEDQKKRAARIARGQA